jgi:hypothetical protein
VDVSYLERMEVAMRRSVKLTWVLPLFTVYLHWTALSSSVQAGSDPKIVEAAKQEGAVSYDTTMTLSQSKKVVDAFQRKYPFIKPEPFRGGGRGAGLRFPFSRSFCLWRSAFAGGLSPSV